MSEKEVDRPIGVSIVSALYALMALVFIILGVVFIGVGDVLIEEILKDNPEMDYLNGLNLIFGGVIMVVGLIAALISFGLYKGWGIMWYVGMILAVIGILMSLLSLAVGSIGSIVPLVIDAVIVYYLLRPNVKMFFLEKV